MAHELRVLSGRDIRREKLLMRVFQHRLLGPVSRRIARPHDIVEIGMGFWASRVLLIAVEFGLFTELAKHPHRIDELMDKMGWHPRATVPMLDCLAGMKLIKRDRDNRYRNSWRAALFLDRNKPSYLGGLMELSSKRLYDIWSGLGHLLRTGEPQAHEDAGGNEFFSTLYPNPDALQQFLSGMTGISTAEATLIAARFPWKDFRTFVDIGGAQGALAVRVALTHRHLTGRSFDLAPVGPIFEQYVSSFGLADRLHFIPGDMHELPLPRADVITFGHLLHGFSEHKRIELMTKAYDSLPPGGALLVYDAMVDTRSPRNYMPSLSSLNIMLETQEGFEASRDEYVKWFRRVGFGNVRVVHLIGPTSMVFGYKGST